MTDSSKMDWQSGEEQPLWRQQITTALGASRGFNARLLVSAEIFLDLTDTLIGRIALASIAVSLAWWLL